MVESQASNSSGSAGSSG
jgi:leucine-zipper-like transcriptional regulator 1